ncbi:MAG: saccharopine dehydrogenase C-terminal domain-containing protein, partial [Planctomycetota bacterium]|nr:saccharopine dehydrogenase C-terminal domain-containing protein [Planctomycetota bacterium]
ECFYTDGLRTLLSTMRDVPNMAEKTIRYQGHSAQIKTLLECGFLNTRAVEFKGKKIIPRDFSLSLLGPKLLLGREKDFILMRVEVKGDTFATFGARKTLRYDMVDYHRGGVTAMARTTGYPCAIVARLIKRINKVGIIPPEELGRDETVFSEILRQLERRKIKIMQF